LIWIDKQQIELVVVSDSFSNELPD